MTRNTPPRKAMYESMLDSPLQNSASHFDRLVEYAERSFMHSPPFRKRSVSIHSRQGRRTYSDLREAIRCESIEGLISDRDLLRSQPSIDQGSLQIVGEDGDNVLGVMEIHLEVPGVLPESPQSLPYSALILPVEWSVNADGEFVSSLSPRSEFALPWPKEKNDGGAIRRWEALAGVHVLEDQGSLQQPVGRPLGWDQIRDVLVEHAEGWVPQVMQRVRRHEADKDARLFDQSQFWGRKTMSSRSGACPA